MGAAEARREAYGDDPITRFMLRWILLGMTWLFLGGILDLTLSAAGLGSFANVAFELLVSLWRGLTLRLPEAFFWLAGAPWLLALVIALLIDLGLVPAFRPAPSRRALAEQVEALLERLAKAEAATARVAHGVFERVEVKAFRVCDAAGRMRAILGCEAEGAMLGLTDEHGTLRIALHVGADGTPRVALYDGEERGRIELAVEGGEPLVAVRRAAPAPDAAKEPGPPGYL